MLKPKNICQVIESVQIYKESQRREILKRRREVIDAACKTLQAGGITNWEYSKIVKANSGLIIIK